MMLNENPAFRSLFIPEFLLLIGLFARYRYELRIAGGAVRDILLGKTPRDIDFATSASALQMHEMYRAENVEMVVTNGEKYGVITCRIGEEKYEVATLRGKAEPERTRVVCDWQIDSERRDLTVNSMFIGLDGTLYDYCNGLEDLEHRRVRFVGDAEARIQEDYIRQLRYFRFFDHLSSTPAQHDDATLDVIKRNVKGLGSISSRRMWIEIKKFLLGQQVVSLLRLMHELGVTKHIGLRSTINLEEFERVWKDCADLKPMPMTLIVALLQSENEIYTLEKQLKVSKEELQLGLFIMRNRHERIEQIIDRYRDMAYHAPKNEIKIQEKCVELLKYTNQRQWIDFVMSLETPQFPVSDAWLVRQCVRPGSKIYQSLRRKFRESRFTMNESDMLAAISEARKLS